MALSGKQAYALSKTYTDATVEGGGALKGKNCTISSITDITGGHRVTFQWTLDNGTVQTDTMDVIDGVDGTNGTNGTNGVDGVSPEITITDITGGHSVKITDKEHPSGQTFNVLDGVDGTNGTNGTDGVDGVSPTVTIEPISTGHRVIITDKDHPTGQSFDVIDGTGSGDMQASVYDSTSAVSAAGGIASYVSGCVDSWTTVSYADANMNVVFDNLDNSYGYALYADDTLAVIKSMTKGTGTTSGIKLTYVVDSTGITSGVTPFYLRVLK